MDRYNNLILSENSTRNRFSTRLVQRLENATVGFDSLSHQSDAIRLDKLDRVNQGLSLTKYIMANRDVALRFHKCR